MPLSNFLPPRTTQIKTEANTEAILLERMKAAGWFSEDAMASLPKAEVDASARPKVSLLLCSLFLRNPFISHEISVRIALTQKKTLLLQARPLS
jgi:hypothetical protein